MHTIDWDAAISRTLESMPHGYRDRLRHVAIVVEDEPSEDVRREENLGKGDILLGYYHGIPLPERDEGYGIGGALPDVITLYSRAILEEARTTGTTPEQVAHETLWHEIGHYFGLDEAAVRRLEDRRDGDDTIRSS